MNTGVHPSSMNSTERINPYPATSENLKKNQVNSDWLANQVTATYYSDPKISNAFIALALAEVCVFGSTYCYFFVQLTNSEEFGGNEDYKATFTKTKNVATKAIKEFKDSLELLEKGCIREALNKVPFFNQFIVRFFDFYYNNSFKLNLDKIRKENDFEALKSLILQVPNMEVTTKTLHDVIYSNCIPSAKEWTISSLENKKLVVNKTLTPEIFSKVHDIALREMRQIYNDLNFGTSIDKLISRDHLLKINIQEIEKYRATTHRTL